jgi:hypothetical protein
MTRKLAISVPDDVAARLDQESNVSAFITESIRRRMVGEQTRHALAAAGRPVSEEGVARAKARLDALRAAVTPQLQEEAEQLRARIASGRP